MTRLRIPDPIPQVGALLDLDTRLPDSTGDRFKYGDKHWRLNGSCILMAPDRILTLRHVYEGDSTIAAFFPYEGFFELTEAEPVAEHQVFGDNLILLRLEARVLHSTPLGWKRIRGVYKEDGYAEVCGYGAWSGPGFVGVDGGVQARLRVELGRPPRGSGIAWPRTDNLDVSWSAYANGGVRAGQGNSGGPLLWDTHGGWKVVGVSRETDGDRQIASWIGNDRNWWLKKELGDNRGLTAPPDSFKSSARRVAAPGDVFEFEVPRGIRHAQATISASPGLRLQAEIVAGRPSEKEAWLDELSDRPGAAGTFLFRELDQDPSGTDVVTVGVVPYKRAPRKAESVVVQASVLFKE